jgi:TolB protein
VTDSDNDGVPDEDDQCPEEAGPASNEGCPEEAPGVTDSDNDGVPDEDDQCPEEAGPASNDGCPEEALVGADSDDDGVPDEQDICPATPGDRADGCPSLGCQRQNPDRLDCSSLEVGGQCQDSAAVFTIHNTGSSPDGDMRQGTQWRLVDVATGQILQSGVVQLAGGATMTITWDGGGEVRLEADQQIGHPGSSQPRVTLNCGPREEQPLLSLGGVCNTLTGNVNFTVSNIGAAMTDPTAWSASDGQSGDLGPLSAGDSEGFSIAPDASGSATFEVAEFSLTSSVNNCLVTSETGSLRVNKVVRGQGPDASFSVCIAGPSYPGGNCQSVSAGGAALWTNLEPGDYTVTEIDPGEGWSVSGSGVSVTVAAAQTAATTITNDYGQRYTICHAAGLADEPANWVILRDPPWQAVFGQAGHFNENGTPQAGHEQDFLITSPEDEERCGPQEPENGSLSVRKLVQGQGPDVNFTICIAGPSYPGGDCQTISGGSVAAWSDLDPGDYTVTETDPGEGWTVSGSGVDVTVEAGDAASHTIRNNYDQRYTFCHVAGRAEQPANYVILRDLPWQAVFGQAGHFYENGTPRAGHEQDFLITSPEDEERCQGDEPELGDLEVRKVVEGDGPETTFEICVTGPSFPNGDCQTVIGGGVVTWTDLEAGEYTVTETDPGPEWTVSGGGAVTVEDGSTASVTVTNTYNPPPPELTLTGECDMDTTMVVFTVTNTGDEMTDPTAWSASDGQSGDLQLGAGDSQTFTIAPDENGSATFTIDEFNLSETVDDCAPPPPVCGATSETGQNDFPVVDMDPTFCRPPEAPHAPWTEIPVGGPTCPVWFVYHTNQTGDWEVFRLGDLPDNPGADPNLSQGVGPRVFDTAPSRSPDGAYIAFASNRDGNWEIYIGSTDGTFQQRVTYTVEAIDTDPVWSPVGDVIAYESARDGNWEIYLVNVADGIETRLTEDDADDLNPFWSDDGTKLVFQSDRDGFWQIYELDLATGDVTRLSDEAGDDHDPQYSHDVTLIAFWSLRDGDNGVLYVMNADGTDVHAISNPDGDASNHAFSPQDRYIAYQSDLDGDLDIYVYEFASEDTRHLTDNDIPDYAPTWRCAEPNVIFTSDITEDPNLFEVSVEPIGDDPIKVEDVAAQLTDDEHADQYPEGEPTEENASRQRSLPRPAKNK